MLLYEHPNKYSLKYNTKNKNFDILKENLIVGKLPQEGIVKDSTIVFKTIKNKDNALLCIDDYGNHVYVNNENRLVAYNNKNGASVLSYPRIILQNISNNKLNSNEDIHHIDNNVLNNSIDNLQIINKIDHLKIHSKYNDKYEICKNCGKEFLWSAKSQRNFYSNQSRFKSKNNTNLGGPFCSRFCSGQYSRYFQLTGKFKNNNS